MPQAFKKCKFSIELLLYYMDFQSFIGVSVNFILYSFRRLNVLLVNLVLLSSLELDRILANILMTMAS